jgi:hypothetical protein
LSCLNPSGVRITSFNETPSRDEIAGPKGPDNGREW